MQRPCYMAKVGDANNQDISSPIRYMLELFANAATGARKVSDSRSRIGEMNCRREYLFTQVRAHVQGISYVGREK